MPNKHQLSPCCRAKIYRFGGRRRKCAQCTRTWRVYPHKRGRKHQRIRPHLATRVVRDGQRNRDQQRWYSTITLRGVQKRTKKRIQRIATAPRSWPQLRGRYILIADGQWYRFHGQDYVLFILLLKPRRRNTAYILDPVLLQGGERLEHWNAAIDTIPPAIQERICALVSDHFRASECLADARGWRHQLCHFHLLSALQKRRGRRKRRIPGASTREEIYQTVAQLLRGDAPALEERLYALLDRSNCPTSMRMICRSFLQSKDRYYTYRTYNALTIPNTSNAAESLGKCIRKRTRCLRTPDAVIQWATAYVRMKKTMTCNSKTPSQNR